MPAAFSCNGTQIASVLHEFACSMQLWGAATGAAVTTPTSPSSPAPPAPPLWPRGATPPYDLGE